MIYLFNVCTSWPTTTKYIESNHNWLREIQKLHCHRNVNFFPFPIIFLEIFHFQSSSTTQTGRRMQITKNNIKKMWKHNIKSNKVHKDIFSWKGGKKIPGICHFHSTSPTQTIVNKSYREKGANNQKKTYHKLRKHTHKIN